MHSDPPARKNFVEIKGRRMAYIDEGEGDPIVFQHGNLSSSHLWRKVMSSCRGLGRLVACDLIGMGDSDKLPNSGPDRYAYAEQRDFLFALWEELGVRERVVFVVHDWGSVLGFDWARRHPGRVQGIAYMEALVTPLTWDDFPGPTASIMKAFRSPAGEDMILRDNIFLERMLIASVKDHLSAQDEAEYRKPFLNPGEDRRPLLTWPRQLPIEGEPADVFDVVAKNGEWLQSGGVPKLWIKGNPGGMMNGRVADFASGLPNQSQVTVPGMHFLQESAGPEVGAAVASFVRGIQGKPGEA